MCVIESSAKGISKRLPLSANSLVISQSTIVKAEYSQVGVCGISWPAFLRSISQSEAVRMSLDNIAAYMFPNKPEVPVSFNPT